MAQMNTWKGSYAYNIDSYTTNIAVASSYIRTEWKYMCLSGGYIANGDSYSSSIDNNLSIIPGNTTLPQKVANLTNSADLQYCNNALTCGRLRYLNFDA